MTIDHKAFVFDEAAFASELRPILEESLRTRSSYALVEFIDSRIGGLRNPYDGELLDQDWRESVETSDVDTFGDFALTKYYDPTKDIGLGGDWESAQAFLIAKLGNIESPVLGRPVVCGTAIFDPGKMGSYFQSAAQVEEHLRSLARFPSEARDYSRVMALLQAGKGSGLYITF